MIRVGEEENSWESGGHYSPAVLQKIKGEKAALGERIASSGREGASFVIR